MVERLRIYKGINELNYAQATIEVTDDFVINSGTIEIEANPVVTSGSIIDFKKSDGSTNVFSGKVQKLTKSMTWFANIFTNGYELMNTKIQNVYVNRSPEYILQDIIDNYTQNLSYASTAVSGFTLQLYIADGYLIDVIKDLMDILRWPVRIDVSDNVYFEPKGTIDNGYSFRNDSASGNCNILEWEEDQDEMFNHVTIVGGFESYSTEETIAAESRYEFTSTYTSGSASNKYCYWKLLSDAYVFAAGDQLYYEVYIDDSSITYQMGIEINFTDATAGRGLGTLDQNGVNFAPGSNIETYAKGKWYQRTFSDFGDDAAGKTIDYVSIADEGDTTGTNICRIRNIKVLDSNGALKHTITGTLINTNAYSSDRTGNITSGSTDYFFTLSKKPSGALVVKNGGTEINPATYEIDASNKIVTFESDYSSLDFSYSYNRPIIVDNQDDASILKYGEIAKEVQAPWLSTFLDARKYSQSLLDSYSGPLPKVKVFQPFLNFDINVNEKILVYDSVRNKNATLIIKKITYNAKENATYCDLGTRDAYLTDWQREVEDRIKKIEKRNLNTDDRIFSRLFKAGLKATISISESRQYNEPKDTFWFNHPTLSRVRTVVNGHIENFEADCTNNGHNGTWYGTNVDGSQYVFPAYRLYGGDFNGTNTYVRASDSIVGVQTICFFAKPTEEERGVMQLTATATVSIDADGKIITSGLTNPKIFVNKIETDLLGTGTYKLVTITCDSINTTDFEVGRVGSNYYYGELDEIMLFDNKITTANMQTIIDKNWYDSDNNYNIAGCLLHWAMDNPKLGIRTTSRSDI